MAQIIMTLVPNNAIQNIYKSRQISQILVHPNNNPIDINYDINLNKVIVFKDNNWYYLESPDINNFTIKQVINALGYNNYLVDIQWIENNFALNTLLNTPVKDAPLNQIDLYIRD